jgi:hypothetical protein
VSAFNFCCPSELDTLPHLSMSGKSWKAHKLSSKYWVFIVWWDRFFAFIFFYIFNTTDMEQTKVVLILSCKSGIIDLLSNFNMYWLHAQNHLFVSCW